MGKSGTATASCTGGASASSVAIAFEVSGRGESDPSLPVPHPLSCLGSLGWLLRLAGTRTRAQSSVRSSSSASRTPVSSSSGQSPPPARSPLGRTAMRRRAVEIRVVREPRRRRRQDESRATAFLKGTQRRRLLRSAAYRQAKVLTVVVEGWIVAAGAVMASGGTACSPRTGSSPGSSTGCSAVPVFAFAEQSGGHLLAR